MRHSINCSRLQKFAKGISDRFTSLYASVQKENPLYHFHCSQQVRAYPIQEVIE